MKALILILALVFMSVPAMAEVPDFNEGWTVVDAEQSSDGRKLGFTLVNQDQTAKWKAAMMLAVPQPVGVVPVIVVLYDGCELKRYVLKDGAYVEFPFDNPEAVRAIKNHLNRFVGKNENI